MEEYYKNNREQIYEELLLVDLLIHAEVVKFRVNYKEDQNKLKGLYISEEEVDELLKGKPIGNEWTSAKEDVNARYEELLKAINKMSKSIGEKIKNSIQNFYLVENMIIGGVKQIYQKLKN